MYSGVGHAGRLKVIVLHGHGRVEVNNGGVKGSRPVVPDGSFGSVPVISVQQATDRRHIEIERWEASAGVRQTRRINHGVGAQR